MLREPIVVLCLLAHIGTISLLGAGCARPAPLPVQPAPLPVLGPKPGTLGAADHCEVIVTACTAMYRWDVRPGCWVLNFNAEVRGRDANLACRVAMDMGRHCGRSAPGIASLERVGGLPIPLAPAWETIGAARLEDDSVVHRHRIDPCTTASRAHHWQWRVKTSFSLICSENPEGLVRVALNGEVLMAAMDPRGRLGAITLDSPPAEFQVPEETTLEAPTSGAGIGP